MTNTDKADLENTLYLDLKDGRVVIEMRPDLAPNHVARIKELARQGYYDGVVFHRVIDGFMAQGGDPTGTGSGGSGKKLKAEFSREKHVRGTCSMARTNVPDSADSQLFIMFEPARSLDGQYSIWGQVVSGMEFVDNIKKGDSFANGIVREPDSIIRMQVAADVEE
jgi:peptidylprolyl isomerase